MEMIAAAILMGAWWICRMIYHTRTKTPQEQARENAAHAAQDILRKWS